MKKKLNKVNLFGAERNIICRETETEKIIFYI